MDAQSSSRDASSFQNDHIYHLSAPASAGTTSAAATASSSGSSTADKNNSAEMISHLKQMLLVNLDLIQEQANELLVKEKQINKLRAENDQLRAKVDKLERRQSRKSSHSSKTKQQQQQPPVVLFNGASTSAAVATPLANGNAVNSTSLASTSALTPSAITPKKPRSSQTPRPKTPARPSTILSAVTTPETPTASDQPPADPYEFVADDSQSQPAAPPPKPRRKPPVATPSTPAPTPRRPPRTHAFMTTASEYITCNWRQEEFESNEAAELASSLEVPSWTVKECHGCYSIEGTENLSDDVFLRRHAKFEVDERRRKKWDVQRLREIRTVERLKRRMMREEYEEREKKEAQVIRSFFPPPEAVRFIQLVEEVPVQAFGEPIPVLRANDFMLPWLSKSGVEMGTSSPTTSFTKTRFFKKK